MSSAPLTLKTSPGNKGNSYRGSDNDNDIDDDSNNNDNRNSNGNGNGNRSRNHNSVVRIAAKIAAEAAATAAGDVGGEGVRLNGTVEKETVESIPSGGHGDGQRRGEPT